VQQYFFVACSLRDIIRRHFRNPANSWNNFADKVAVQLNDTHPAIAVVELTRILLDEQNMAWDAAWAIVSKTFAYTNHTLLPEALEKWSVGLFERLLPRHLQIIYDINSKLLQTVEAKWPGDNDKKRVCSLIEENGRIVGVVVGDGEERILAPRGVLLCAGGFAKDAEYRMPLQGVTGEWSPASPDDTGDAHKIGAAFGADLALMDAATWFPVSIYPDGTINPGIWERTLPGSIIVDHAGQRYTNEAASYVDAGLAMFERDRTTSAIPSWLIFDSRYRNRYFFGGTPPGVTEAFVKNGFFIRAATLEELAGKCGIDADGLKRTVQRVNAMAATGVDEDFQRGANVYDQYYGDPTNKKNPSFGPIDKAPFFAVRQYPGDLSTKGGLMADEHARVLRPDGSVIEGLYAAGNCAAPVMGRTYPGAGATLGPSMVFAWIAARHSAGAN